MCVFGYYSRLPYLVEMTGLTQYSLARQPIARRGWIGHEKRATDAWLEANEIHLVVSQRFPPIARPPGPARADLVLFGVARVIHRDDALMRELASRPGVTLARAAPE
jgi:hypothetical protein